MRQLDGLTRQRFPAANEHLREIATIATDRPSGEVISHPSGDANAAVQHAEELPSSSDAESRDTAAQQAADFQGRLGQVVRAQHTLAAQLNQAMQALDRAEHSCAAGATTSAQHFAQQQADLAAAKAEAAALRDSLERQLATVYIRAADAEAAAERQTRREAELAKAVEAHQNLERRFSAAVILLQEQDAEREATAKRLAKHDADLAEAHEKRLSLESQLREGVAKYETLAGDLSATRQQLAHADSRLRETESRHALATTTAAAQRNERLAEQEALLREETADRQRLEGQLADAHAALHAAEERAEAERVAAMQRTAERDAEFVARRDQDTATRQTLQQALTAASNKVAEAETAIRDAEQRHASHIMTVTARLADQQVQYETRLAETAAARDLIGRRLREVEASFERSREEAAGDAAAAADRHARLDAQRIEALANLQTLEGQLADVHAARHLAEQSIGTERRQAAERDAEFAAQLRQEAATRETLEQALTVARSKVAETETAIRDAEQRHASHMTSLTTRFADEQVQYETRLVEAAAARDLVDQRLREVEMSFERSREEAAADAAAAAERQAGLEAQRVEALAHVQMLEGQLADTRAALQAAEQLAAAERVAATQRAAERDVEFAGRLRQEATTRETLDQALTAARNKVAETETAVRDAEQRHALHITTVTARFADQQAQYETRLSESAAARDLVDQRLREVEASFERSRHAAEADAAAAAERLRVVEQSFATERLTAARQAAQRQTDFETAIALETSGRRAVQQDLAKSQQKLADSESALRDAEQRHVSETKTAADQFAVRQREFEALLAQTTAVRDASEVRLHEAEATILRIHDERAAEAIAFIEQRTQLESELGAATAHGETLERRLTEITNALHAAEELVVSERVTSAEQATARQTEFDHKLSLELGTRNAIEQTLTATRQDLQQSEAALRAALAQHAREMTTASNELDAQQRDYTMQLTQASVAHAALEQKLANAEQRHASAQEAAATQLAEHQDQYETHLAEITTARDIVRHQLRDTEATLARSRQENDANALAAAERLSQRESELATASADRQVLEGRLADTETALKDAEAQAVAERTAAQQQSAQRQAEFDAQLTQEIESRRVVERDLTETRVAFEQTRQAFLEQAAALTNEMRDLEVRLTQELAREVADYEARLESLSRVHEDATENFERVRQAKESELQRLGDDYAAARQMLEKVRADAVQTLERIGSEHAAELVRINALVAERDGQMKDLAAQHREQVDQLQSGLKAVTKDFEETRRHRDKLQLEANRVPPLKNQLEASRAENRRQFDGSPIGILRCSETGALSDANRALITALGYQTVDELRALDSAASLFESPDDFRWFIENRETPSEIDWIWKKKDGSRLMMRLRALRISVDVLDIVAEDMTSLRAVEERLRRAQRLEAVGRLAAEVAVTCDNLLRNVSHDTQQWLSAVDSNSAQRRQGELILSDMARATTYLQQLSGYGAKQTTVRAVVDVTRLLRDLGPVLKRVAGDDIDLVFPKKGSALNVDVDAERVERILVNITAYGRERMPSGSRLIIELARVEVDRDFITKYPSVRPGAHALISVAKVKTSVPAEWPKDSRQEATAMKATSERPSIDLGTLQALIDDCGGHLWMKAEPDGDIELKVHLPLRSADPSRTAGIASALGRSVSSWFQSQ